MELLFTSIPNEIINIITNFIRLINLSNDFPVLGLGLQGLINLVKEHNCLLTVEFNDRYPLIYGNIAVYGELPENHVLGRHGESQHPFESAVHQIKLPERYYWQNYWRYNLNNIKYETQFVARLAYPRGGPTMNDRYCLRFVLVDIKLSEFAKRLNCNNILLIE